MPIADLKQNLAASFQKRSPAFEPPAFGKGVHTLIEPEKINWKEVPDSRRLSSNKQPKAKAV
jgi:hypothetical protein